jgi:alpha-beta hydrolase superfamily lysophospholipase
MHPKVDPNGIITFGYYEYRQIHTVMEWIKSNINEEVIIWGRSMGAVCAVRYQHHYGEARELVLDSPFHNLVELFTQKLA